MTIILYGAQIKPCQITVCKHQTVFRLSLESPKAAKAS